MHDLQVVHCALLLPRHSQLPIVTTYLPLVHSPQCFLLIPTVICCLPFPIVLCSELCYKAVRNISFFLSPAQLLLGIPGLGLGNLAPSITRWNVIFCYPTPFTTLSWLRLFTPAFFCLLFYCLTPFSTRWGPFLKLERTQY